jgi:hypothetical protein
LISNPNLCFGCKNKLKLLGKSIQGNLEEGIDLVNEIDKIVSRKWMGSLQEKDSPIYNLKHLYRYDVDRNSGKNKRFLEKFRDSIYDKSADWVVGGIIGTIITIVSALAINLLK